MESGGTVVCTFVVASADRILFTEERAAIPEVGELIRYDGKVYEVLAVSPQERLPGEPLDEQASQLPVLVRVQLTA